jgi:hypothetical protein
MEDRVARFEDDMREVKSVSSRLEPMIVRRASAIEQQLTDDQHADALGRMLGNAR